MQEKKYKPDPKILEREVVIETFRSSGPGGQRKNKVATAVRLRHLPTGITVVATEHRFQSQNRKLAFERLQERLRRINQPKKRRIPTSISPGVIERKKEEKKTQSHKKQLRRKIIKDPDG